MFKSIQANRKEVFSVARYTAIQGAALGSSAKTTRSLYHVQRARLLVQQCWQGESCLLWEILGL